MRKKALSLLLAVSMVFSMNAVAMAAETTDSVEVEMVQKANEDYDVQTCNGMEVVITKDIAAKLKEVQKANTTAQSSNSSFSVNAYVGEQTTVSGIDLEFSGINRYSIVGATGVKIKAKDLNYQPNTAYVSANGYRVGIKSVRMTKRAKNAGDITKFKFSRLMPSKCVEKYNPATKQFEGVLLSEAKKAYPGLKTAFNSFKKTTEFQTVICPRYIVSTVSIDYVRSLVAAGEKKQVSESAIRGYANGVYDAKKDVARSLVVTMKNGQVKRVKLPVFKASRITRGDATIKRVDGSRIGLIRQSYYRISYRTLKAGKDYTIEGNKIKLDASTRFIYLDSASSNFIAK